MGVILPNASALYTVITRSWCIRNLPIQLVLAASPWGWRNRFLECEMGKNRPYIIFSVIRCNSFGFLLLLVAGLKILHQMIHSHHARCSCQAAGHSMTLVDQVNPALRQNFAREILTLGGGGSGGSSSSGSSGSSSSSSSTSSSSSSSSSSCSSSSSSCSSSI